MQFPEVLPIYQVEWKNFACARAMKGEFKPSFLSEMNKFQNILENKNIDKMIPTYLWNYVLNIHFAYSSSDAYILNY